MSTDRPISTITAFHASPIVDILAFHPFSHFGSRKAAIERAAARKFSDHEMTLYEVELHLENPLEIYDEGGAHTAEYLVSAIRSADRKALNLFASDAILRKNEEEGETAALALLQKAMVGMGRYDGLTYVNTTEGNEELSWVVFNPDQVKILNTETLVTAKSMGMR